MLTSLRLRNFKSFADAEAPLGPLTLLVGANASGKSNVLDALCFLRGVATLDAPIEQILQGRGAARDAGWAGIRGGIHEAIRNGADAFELSTTCRAPHVELSYRIACGVAPHPHVRGEALWDNHPGEPYFRAYPAPPGDPADGPGLEISHVGNDGALRTTRSWDSRAVLPRFKQAGGEASALEMAQAMLDALAGVTLLDLHPAAMRGYVPQAMGELGATGENLSAVLFQLCKDPDRKRGFVDWLAELCAPELADIDFSTTDEEEVMLRLLEKDNIRVSARSLSDGTLRFLGEIVALRTAPEGSVILMEELGNGLHPRRMHLLVEYLEAITAERRVQVIATTHSPLVLQALAPRARADAIVLGRVAGRPGTVMRRLGDLPRFEELAARRGADYLFTTGWLEQAL